MTRAAAWPLLLADLALLLMAVMAVLLIRQPPVVAAPPPSVQAAAAPSRAIAIANWRSGDFTAGAATPANAADAARWWATAQSDPRQSLIIEASIDAADRAAGADLSLATARAAAMQARLPGAPAVTIRVREAERRAVTLSLSYSD